MTPISSTLGKLYDSNLKHELSKWVEMHASKLLDRQVLDMGTWPGIVFSHSVPSLRSHGRRVYSIQEGRAHGRRIKCYFVDFCKAFEVWHGARSLAYAWTTHHESIKWVEMENYVVIRVSVKKSEDTWGTPLRVDLQHQWGETGLPSFIHIISFVHWWDLRVHGQRRR